MAFNYDWQQAAYLHPNQHCQFGAVVNFFLCDRISCDNHYYETIDGKTADITDEIPFHLPDNWAWCRIGTALFLQAGKFISANEIHEIEDEKHCYPCYGGNGKRGFVDRFNTSGEHPIIGRQGALCGNINFASGEFYSTEHAVVVDVFAKCSSALIALFLTALNLNQYSTATAQPGLSVNVINSLLFPLPPLTEQQQIVEQIETLLGYVDIIDTDAETLEKSITLAKQKILDLAIRGKLVPQDPTDEPASELLKKIKAEKEALVKAGKIKKDKHESFIFKGDDNCYHENIVGKVTDITDEILFDLPVGWEWCRLATISEFDLGKTLDRQKNTGNYRKYLRSVNVLWGNIDLADVKEMRFEDTELERYSIKKGDLLICEGGDVGRCAVWDKDFVFYYQNALHRVRFYQKCVPLFYQFVMMFFENTGLLKEISQGVTIKHLTKNTLNSMFFPLPPLAEQKRIVSQIEKLFAVLETMRG